MINWGTGWSVTAAEDDTVYVGTRQGQILALRAAAGDSTPEPVWWFTLKDEHGVFGAPAIGEEYIYIADKGDRGGERGRILALRKDRLPGDSLRDDEWDFQGDEDGIGGIVGGPAIAKEEGLVLVGTDDGIIFAISTATGDIRNREAWRFPTDGQVWSTPVVANGVVYFGSMDRHIYALSLAEGLDQSSRLLWKYKTGGAIVAKPLVMDGPLGKMVVVGAFDRKMYALKANTTNPQGELVWDKPFKGDEWFWAGAITDGDTIYAATMGSTVYALDKGGSLLWEKHLEEGSPIVSTPVVVGDDLVVATDEGKLYLLDARSGQRPVGFKDLESRVKASLSNIGDTVFVGVEDSTVRGVDVAGWRDTWTFSTKDR